MIVWYSKAWGCLYGRSPRRLCTPMSAWRGQEAQGQAGGDPHLPAEGTEDPFRGGMEGESRSLFCMCSCCHDTCLSEAQAPILSQPDPMCASAPGAEGKSIKVEPAMNGPEKKYALCSGGTTCKVVYTPAFIMPKSSSAERVDWLSKHFKLCCTVL